MKAPILKASNSVIAFAIHGQQVKKAASMLVQIGRA
jgi:hypothetical protein